MMICNHSSFFDPWIIAHPSPRAVSIMINEDGFKAPKITRWYLEKIGGFPKKKGGTDIKSMKIALKRLKADSPLLIFPEGQTSWDGETQPIYAGIEKLAKRTKKPLILVRLAGNYLSRPWWSSNDRKGTIIVSRKVITAEELAEMTPDQIRNEITSYIYNNDCKNEEIQKTKFVCDAPADGLHRLLWKCPSCGAEDQLTEKETAVNCLACNTDITVTPNLQLENSGSETVNDIHDWVKLQRTTVLDKLANVEDSTELITDKSVRLVDVDYSGRVITLDTGSLTLTPKELVFNGEDGVVKFSVDDISTPVFQQKDIINFDDEKGSEVRFFIDQGTLYKWLAFLRYLKGYDEAEKIRYY